MLEVEFLGGAHTVTGSIHRVRTPHAQILLECGLFQGRRRESLERNRHLPVHPAEIDAVVLSHAHIDHSGALPLLTKQGYSGAIYATPATRDLCEALFEDAARIQQSDSAYLERLVRRGELDGPAPPPLYDHDDARTAVAQMVPIPYHNRYNIAPGVDVTFYDAGHVLGSAVVALDVDDEGQQKRIVFTGDLGRHDTVVVREPEVPAGACFLITESTYGDRLHPPYEHMTHQLEGTIQRTYERGGKVIIPSFALERAQEVIYALKRLQTAGTLPPMPVYVDSPLTIRITEVFKRHPDCYDQGLRALFEQGDSPFELEGLRYVQSADESRAITASLEPAIIIAGSGMCESGRVLHHLRACIGQPEHTIVIVGFQAHHTLGRRLVERRDQVRIFGIPHRRAAQVVVLNGFSAHADQAGLVEFAETARERGPLRQVALVHGEPKAQEALAALLEERGFPSVAIPDPGDRLQL